MTLFTLSAGNAQELGSGGVNPEVAREIQYAQTLVQWGMPDYAELVIRNVQAQAPEAAALVKVIELQSLIAVGKFDEVKAIIAREPNQDSQEAWAMKVALADGYYAWGKYAEAQEIYQSFFAKYPQGPPEALNAFYMESAYKYAQMLILMGNEKEAIRAYDNVLKAKLESGVQRQVLGEKAELLVKMAERSSGAERAGYIQQVEEINNQILWVQDLWFGKAIVNMAHIHMMKGEVDQAMTLIDDYRDQLLEIDEILRQQEEEFGDPLTKLSPMAQTRYMIAKMLMEQAEKLRESNPRDPQIVELLAGKQNRRGGRSAGALQHFYNVFIRYPTTQWAPDAGVLAQEVQQWLERDFGAQIGINISPEQMQAVQVAQFQNARAVLNQKQYEEAAEAYVKVLALFPEVGASVAALGDLVQCYMELGDELKVDMVIGYLAERFPRHPRLMVQAGDQLLRIAILFQERQNMEKSDEIYDLFFEHYVLHPRTPALLYSFGDRALREENFPRALDYYYLVVSNYPGEQVHVESLNKIAYIYGQTGEVDAEAEALQTYAAALLASNEGRPGHAYVNALFRRAFAEKRKVDTMRREGKLEEAEVDSGAPGAAGAETTALQAELEAKAAALKAAMEEFEKQNEQYRRAGALFQRAREAGDQEQMNRFRQIGARLKPQFDRAQEEVAAAKAAHEAAKDALDAAAQLPSVPATDDPYLAIANMFESIIAMLTGDDKARFHNTAEEAERNKEILEGSLFFQALSYSLAEGDARAMQRYKVNALQSLGKMVQQFPDSRYAPAALSQMGTLYTVLEKPDEAEQVLAKLQKDYPNSTEARNSLFMLGSNLLELGMRDRAVQVFKQMFEGEGRYSPSQILTAGQELLSAMEYEIALEAFDQVLRQAGGTRGLEEASLMGRGKALVELGRFDEAVEPLDTLLTKYPRSGFTIEASLYLSRAYSDVARREPDNDARRERFNQAVIAMRRMRQFATESSDQARSDLGVARILLDQARAEEEFGAEERARNLLNQSIAAYQMMTLLGDPRDPALREVLADAFYECIPLLLETQKWEEALEDADRFLELYPRHSYVRNVSRWRSEANVNLATSGARTQPAQTEDTGTEAAAQDVDMAEEPSEALNENGENNEI